MGCDKVLNLIFTGLLFSVYVTLLVENADTVLLWPAVCAATYWSVAFVRNSRLQSAETMAASPAMTMEEYIALDNDTARRELLGEKWKVS